MTIQRFGVCMITFFFFFFFVEEINTFIQQSGSWKTFIMLQDIYISMLWAFFSSKIIKNASWSPNQHIRMISEGSCDTEDK